MKIINPRFFTILLLLVGAVSSFGQLKFHVASFGEDQFDLAARDERFKKIDGSGSLYAIIKVSGDDLKEYNFNFGNMNHLVESHEDQLWVYVQKNAKHVTITRSGYNPLRNYDFRTTIEAGKTYVMQLSAQGPVIYTQMVMFQVKPADSKAVVTIKGSEADAVDQMLGNLDASGAVAKNMPYGTYTYRILSENYYPTEGRFTLNDKSQTHIEEVTLRPRFSQITFTVDGGAEIYVNGERKGSGSWTGQLNAGMYQVECRRPNHRNSQQTVTVEENVPRTFMLTTPVPITGTISVLSNPLGAAIKVDGKDYGVTPRNIDGIIIGQHEVTLSLQGYDETKASVEVKENETAELNMSLGDVNVSLKKAVDIATVKKDGEVKLIKNPLKDASQIQIAEGGSSVNNKQQRGPVVSRYPKPESDVDKNIPVAQKQAENTFAFIICNENYADAPVPYSLNDGRMFKEYCQKALGLPEKNINMYEDATFGNIITAIEKMKSIADAYDGEASVIFYYAGHGFPDDKQQTAYLLPIDGDASSITTTGYSLAKLYEEIAGLNLKSSIVFLDACFSGAKREDQMLASSRGVAIKVKDEAPQGKMVVFSAAQGDETAHQLEDMHHGLFTYYLLKGIQNAGGDPDMGTLTEYVTKQVERQSIVINKKKQTPVVLTSQGMQDNWKAWKLR